ncbi:importin subunit beta-1, partial [Tanacetum coccineum]
SVHVKQANIETLGYLCEEVSLDVVEYDQVNKILTTVVQSMNPTNGSNDVKLVATWALYNALSFTQAIFSKDMELDCIMKVFDIFNIGAKAVKEDEEPMEKELHILEGVEEVAVKVQHLEKEVEIQLHVMSAEVGVGEEHMVV